jgi:hypothetical protein
MELTKVTVGRSLGRNPLGVMRRHLDQGRRELSRRKVRRRLGDDPTRAIRSPSDAIEVAHVLLKPVSRRDANYHDVWANVAERPLAELLYAASKQRGGGCGMEWAWHALVNVEADESVPGWQQAADIWDQAGAPLPGQLLKIAGYPPR